MSQSYANGPSTQPLIGETIGENLERTVARFPDHLAVASRHQNRRYTYAEFNAAVKPKPITARVTPDVGGIDLAQAMSYVDAEGLPLEWFYTSFTPPRTSLIPRCSPRSAPVLLCDAADSSANRNTRPAPSWNLRARYHDAPGPSDAISTAGKVSGWPSSASQKSASLPRLSGSGVPHPAGL